ncbi:prepilin-type N-terminal cleavage/methylation domain-containing protein [Colwellia sp. MB02u-6]|uniref:pilus assembly FimT family protein n=1 Tax=Colwellia sp. MB02u-6 TaxID=2759824 RepID=UPI0015F48D73|nr:prepilin-type N-terminal cleavage/methylation domain-containing protein [Colwellia sp. MB02u-6]MBA6329111.1 prepilin-type N-terminal cleavage/methylation domain-containing protein [Colwellia sp. MB02u-6]
MKQLTNNSFSKQKGFTLIELVVVIVILGILAATAAPKFIDLTTDARSSVMKGVQGSVNSAINLAHAKALVGAQTGEAGTIIIGSKHYALVHGFPAVESLGTLGDGSNAENALGIQGLIELDSGSQIVFKEYVTKAAVDANASVPGDTGSAEETAKGFVHTGATDETKCSLAYANAGDSETPPVITSNFDDC